ncbi:aminoacyl-tRNA hydrolase, partial [Streptomyces benahoarensis]
MGPPGPGSRRVVVAKPMSFMNLSGGPVSALRDFYKVPVER